MNEPTNNPPVYVTLQNADISRYTLPDAVVEEVEVNTSQASGSQNVPIYAQNATIKFMNRFDPSKIGHPSRPGENSVTGDPTWEDAQHGISQFVDSDSKKSIGYYDNDFGPYFYRRGFVKVCQKTGKHAFVRNPEDQPFKEKPGKHLLIHYSFYRE